MRRGKCAPITPGSPVLPVGSNTRGGVRRAEVRRMSFDGGISGRLEEGVCKGDSLQKLSAPPVPAAGAMFFPSGLPWLQLASSRHGQAVFSAIVPWPRDCRGCVSSSLSVFAMCVFVFLG